MRERLRDERGLTMVEVVVATLLVGIIGALVMSSMTTMVGTSVRLEERSRGNDDLRGALEIVERDLRAANPIVALPATEPVSRYRTEVSFTVYCAQAGVGDCNARHERAISYRLAGNTLERVEGTRVQRLVGPAGPASLPAAKQRGAVVNPSTRPVFRYFDQRGVELQTDGSSTSPSTHFRDCTLSLTIDLVVVVEPGEAPVTDDITTNGTLRNFHEVDGC